jgi:hypothetical protein
MQRIIMLFVCFLEVFIMSTSLLADVIKKADSETGLKSWQFEEGGVTLEIIQRLPDQTRAFFQGRGFSVQIADDIANSCVFQVIGRNDLQGKRSASLSFVLKQWRTKHRSTEHPIKLQETWDREWSERSVSMASRIAFRWAMFPTEQFFASEGDYGWGMVSFGLEPGSEFDLHLFWTLNGHKYDAWVNNIECAKGR